MSKWLKIVFIASVILNIAFVIGAVWARSYIRKQNFELAAMTAEAEGTVARHILTELESGDPNRTEAVKEQLRKNIRGFGHVKKKNIEQAKETAALWRKAAKQ